KDDESVRAALVYMLYLFGGAALGFVSLVGLSEYGVGAFGSGALTEVTPWTQALVMLGFLGFGVKAAVFPLCRWLPKASVAPTPTTALLHAVAVVNAGAFAVMRFLYQAVGASAIRRMAVWPIMIVLSVLTILYGAVMAVREQQMKRRFAWSTVSNLSYMLFGLALLTAGGMEAGLAHIVYHGLTKIILFFCTGAVLTETGRTQVRQTHGLGRKMPFTFLCFTLAGVSLLGVPPLGGFVSKYALISAAFGESTALSIAGAAALLLAAVLTAVYVFTVVYPAFFMPYKAKEGEKAPHDPGVCMKASLLILCLILLAASIGARPIMDYLKSVAGGVIG
ncbi:MAG: proton-conducting membrane transporter, partial [Clostridia bacterium]|nr:proton-conducting membrane transporter [Clostridia bacterium]